MSPAAALAAVLTTAAFVYSAVVPHSPATDAIGMIGLISGVPLTIILVVLLRRKWLRTSYALKSRTVMWAIGTIALTVRSTSEGPDVNTLIAGEAKVEEVSRAVVDQIRPHASVTTTEKHLFSRNDYMLSFTGAAQFLPNVKVLRIISSGVLVYEHPGLAPDSGMPPY